MTDAEAYVAKLNAMTPAQLEAERRQQTARIDAEQIQRFGYSRAAEIEGRTPGMTRYNEARADAAGPPMTSKEFREMTSAERRHWVDRYNGERDATGMPVVTTLDDANRKHREFFASSMRQWMQPWLKEGQQQVAIWNRETTKKYRDQFAKWKASGSRLNFEEWRNPE